MSDQENTMSSVKVGLLTAWFVLWTGAPVKFVICLLLLAMGAHPWEGSGLAFLLLLSIPIDIWAFGVVANTLFLERFRVQPPYGLGFTVWWQVALISALYFPIFYFIEGGTIAGAKALSQAVLALMEALPVAETISLDLVMWGALATVMLIVLLLIWFLMIGTVVKRQVKAAVPAEESYDARILQWDLMRVPADQPLLLTALTGVGVLAVLGFWFFLPVTTPHPHDDYERPHAVAIRFDPAKALDEAEKILSQAERSLEKIEKERDASSTGSHEG